MVDDAVQYIRDHAGADEPFLGFMGLTRPHLPNHPSARFEGESRIGGYGDCVMVLDWILIDHWRFQLPPPTGSRHPVG